MSKAKSNQASIAGVGMIPFTKPGASSSYDQMGSTAARLALCDAGLSYKDVQQAFAGYVYGDSCSGQLALYQAGMTGIPIINVNNNCATGSSALFLGRQAIESGNVDCVLVVGFEQMQPGAIGPQFTDRPNPFSRFDDASQSIDGIPDLAPALRYFGGAGMQHMQKYGTTLTDFASIRAKASRHAKHNPNAVFKSALSTEDVLASPQLWPGVMTRLMACPPTCGAAAAVLVSESYANKQGLKNTVNIIAQSMTTDLEGVFESHNMMQLVGYDMTRKAALQAYEAAGIGPSDIDVIELHDCFAQNELISYEALGLCPEGGAQKFIADADNTYGGKYVTNPSGGLLSKGHPLGATGLAQCHELVMQLRGHADQRQVEGARFAMQHNLGLGGACVVTLYQTSSFS